MRKQFHILNGDSLKEQFPKSIEGLIMVTRECLVDGDVMGKKLTDLFKIRAEFISTTYSGCNEQDYFEKTVPEFQKMLDIPEDGDINLWFEDDLFCQVNFWFVLHLISGINFSHNLYLIRSKKNCEYNFGGMRTDELVMAYQNRQKIKSTEMKKLSYLWRLYQEGSFEGMRKIGHELASAYPFLSPAIEAHVDRFPQDGNSGRPTQSLVRIMDELNTLEFRPVFKEFCKRESIYGFGDLQVRRIFDKIIDNR